MTAYVPASSTNATMEQVVRSLKEQASGRSNATGNVTLRPSQTFTVVNDANFVAGAAVLLMPKTQGAAYMQSGNVSGGIAPLYVDNSTYSAFTVHHASNPATDLNFVYVIIG